MLVPMRAVLEAADRYRYGQGAFNINSVSQAQAAVEVHELFRSPAILQGADLANGFMGGRADFVNATIEDKQKGARNIGSAVRRFAQESPVPVALHLDHGRDFESVKAAVAGGYTSVMIDGSSLPFEKNMELTREVVKYAHERGVTVEGELGILAGVEDHVFSGSSTYTNPLDAVEFFKKTKVDCLAVSYGTKHGAVKGKDVRLRREIVVAVKECLRHEGIFGVLVSHGSSTVPQHVVREINALGGCLSGTGGIDLSELKSAIASGIGKINVDTDIRLAVTRNMRELFFRCPSLQKSASAGAVYRLLASKPDRFDPREFLTPVMDTVTHGVIPDEDIRALCDCIRRGVQEVAGTLIVQFGSAGRAPLVEAVTLEEMARRYREAGI
ncbi:class II fructose-bisphosphate aldolase [Yanshouia hominis]|uniref:Class II fructose-bisphosphate aldolase n=1 Tax=Yanshouia hominis TaxID=2763673 RepID=A0ABR7NLR7_9FIRM|nr:class II fructose-bisphosphate aldolase [Yanshouia hominis]MBC8576792.1 class II fructose-bisphosphate aldolase [Yanshouia hominis]